MKVNPVYKREMTVSTRSLRLILIFLVFNGILAAVALLNMYSVISQVKATAEIQYSRFLELYIFVSAIECVMLMFITPAITSGSISGERERQTLDLMLTTTMTPAQIVCGKLISALGTMILLVVSSFPVLAVVFVYGGVNFTDLGTLLLCYGSVALFTGSLGVCFSSIFKKSTLATVCSYGFLILIVAGTYAINYFAFSLSRMNVNSYMANIDSVVQQANSGACIYLLLLNPAVTFYAVINEQAGSNQAMDRLSEWFGAQPSNFVMDHWVGISMGLQIILSLVLVFLAVRALDPLRKKRIKQR